MKSILRNMTLALVTTFGAHAALHAQSTTPPAVVTAGTFTLTFDSSFTSSLTDQGIRTKYISNEVSSTTSPEFQLAGGLVDLSNGSSEVASIGGVKFANGTTTVMLERLTLESDQTNRAKVTALVIVNGAFMGRHDVFTVTSGAAFTFPLSDGQQTSQPITFKVTPTFATEISSYFQVSPNTYKGMIGQFSLNLLLSPQE